MSGEWFYRAIAFEEIDAQERSRAQAAAARAARERGPVIRTMGSE